MFPAHYFAGIENFKKVVFSLKSEINTLIGDTKIIFTMKKRSFLGNTLVQNKQLSATTKTRSDNQKCNARGCLQCPLVNENRTLTVNKNIVVVPQHLNCKSKNIIYMWICKLCGVKETYFGRTIQEGHNRTSGHRNCFNEEKWEKSALSLHAK